MANTGPVTGWTWNKSAALDDEPHFVFVVPVLAAELREHHVEVGRLRFDVDDVGGDVAAALLQRIDFSACTWRESPQPVRPQRPRARASTFVLDAVGGEKSGELGTFTESSAVRRGCSRAP